MGSNPSYFKGDVRLPVEQVSWNDCQEFCRRRGAGFRLPSEAEWEYTCRAGTTTRFYFGNNDADLQGFCNLADSSTDLLWNDGYKYTAPVGIFKPNTWGLYDMHGNDWEWCQNWYHESYEGAPTDGSAWESPEGEYRVVRGGSWNLIPKLRRAAFRFWCTPDYRSYSLGVRLLWTP